jgi:putative tricarboxylic transport membrane protein
VENIILGFQTAVSPQVLLFLLVGCLVGLVIGALPGLTGNMAIALMVPLTFSMDASVGLAFLVAVYCSSIYGGSISAILLGIPGTISSFATTLDGYPLAKRGRAGLALGTSTMASVFGGLFSAIVLLFLTPVLADFALKFGPGEYFAVSLVGIACITSISGEDVPKGLLSGMIGLLIAVIGMDPQNGVPRLTFGNVNLLSGISLVASLIGIFGVVSVLKSAEKCRQSKKKAQGDMPTVDKVWIGWKECIHQLPTWFRGSVIGTVVGIIPGADTNVATFMAYDMEKKLSSDPESFGKGNVLGVAAPEAANNAVTGGSLVPLLALGVPGNSTSALFLGAITIHGMTTGPVLFTDHADVVYGLFISVLLANIIMAPLAIFLLRYMKKILSVPEELLAGIILVFCVTGVYAIATNPFDVLVLIVFGMIGYFCYRFKIPTAPMIVAMVLGTMTENNLRQALVASKGSWNFLYTSPVTLALVIIAVGSFFFPFIADKIRKRKGV